MKQASFKTPNFRGWHAIILHRSHPDVDRLTRQMERLGMEVTDVWPRLEPAHRRADIVLFDADMGHEEQFPWSVSDLPMPMIALMGSEAPGRVEWAIQRGAGAHLNKPIESTGLFGALVVATRSFQTHWEAADKIKDLQARLVRRPVVIRAVMRLMAMQNCDSDAAYQTLRAIAMAERLSIEDAADALTGSENQPSSKCGKRS